MDTFKKFIKKNLSPTYSKKWRISFLTGAIILFVLFLLFTFVVRIDILRQWDFDTTVRLQDDIPVRFDHYFSLFSLFGRFEFTLVLLLVILFLKRKVLGVIGFILFGIAHVIEVIGKVSLSQPGPPHMFLRTTDLSTEFPGLYIHTPASYPSGHSMRTVFIAVIVFFIIYATRKIPRYIKIPIYLTLLGIVLVMLVSRVSLGEHWSTDVIGGTLLGAAFALVALIFI